MKTLIQKDTWTPVFIDIYNSQDMKETQMSINRQMEKDDNTHTHTHTHTHTLGYYSAQKEWIFAFCYKVDGPGGHYAKWNKSDRQKKILYVITYMWTLKKIKLVNITQKRNTNIENTLVATSREREGARGKVGVGGWEVQSTMCKIIKLQGYVASTWNIPNKTQYSVVTIMDYNL